MIQIQIQISHDFYSQNKIQEHILIHGHRSLLQVFKFFLLELQHSKGHMMSPEAVPELLPVEAF
jgi:hypothetical protein